jgi:hypothetical protein
VAFPQFPFTEVFRILLEQRMRFEEGRVALTTIYRIYTEDKNKREILRLTGRRFESFTVQPTTGYYRGKRERSIVLEIVDAQPRQINALAEQLRRMNGQKSVLILKTRGSVKISRR